MSYGTGIVDNVVEASLMEINVQLALDRCPDIVRPVIGFVESMWFQKFNIIPSGSSFEGTAINTSADIDLMLELPIGSVKLHTIGLPGFTLIKLTGPKRKLWQKLGCANRQGFLNATEMRELFANCVKVAVSLLQSNVVAEENGPAVTLKITTPEGRNVSVDLTLAIKVDWPDDAREWITRTRVWPDDDLLKEIVLQDGCHVVAKKPSSTCSFPKDGKAFCWRFSFSAAERRLFIWGSLEEGSQSCARQVLCKLKKLKHWLKPLKSYHFKTLWFYLRELKPQSLWNHDQCWERRKDLLSLLEGCLTRQLCPHFFIKTVNLFEEFDPVQCSDLINQVRWIRKLGEMKQILCKKKKFKGANVDELLLQWIHKRVQKKSKAKKTLWNKNRKVISRHGSSFVSQKTRPEKFELTTS
ncbi:uncharacterized protein LOC111323019 [Stylophora pistillata]|uniref:Protein mab-21-like 1 n=1 Tax=Stylophora pistillata TaxID=50429 RepID=A0A2B4SJJ6_STYPI|nr:uncharacterized protein LOC111323019 [Stylophora pistillata]PFX30854.1 Protein mab-21-like 1 [Stylophora pistillata]